MSDLILNRLIDGFENIFQYECRDYSYRRLYSCIVASNELIARVNLLKSPTSGVELEYSFRMSRIDLRFGLAKIRKKIEKVILLDLKSSEYERSSGRYVVYVLTDLGGNIYHVNYVTYGYQRIPNLWQEDRDMACYQFK